MEKLEMKKKGSQRIQLEYRFIVTGVIPADMRRRVSRVHAVGIANAILKRSGNNDKEDPNLACNYGRDILLRKEKGVKK